MASRNLVDKDNLIQIEAERVQASEQVLSRNIPWDALRNATIIGERDLILLRKYDKQPIEAKLQALEENGDEYAALFLRMIVNIGKEETLQYVLTLIEEMLVEDESKAKLFLRLREENPAYPFTPLLRLLNVSDEPDWYIISKACKIIAILFVNCNNLAQDEVLQFLKWVTTQIKTKTGYLELSTALNTLQTLLRRDEFRIIFCQLDGINCLKGLLSAYASNFQILYQAIHCLWLLSYNSEIGENFGPTNVIHNLVELVRTSTREKVIRISLATLRNLMSKGTNNEQMIETNLMKEIDKLQQKKWGDEDILADLEALQGVLHKDVAELSSFDKYKQELYSGELEWTPVHRSEKFWRENATRFEENQNRPLTILVGLLKNESTTPQVLSIACSDVGEFVRFHPQGRQLIQALGAREAIMNLMTTHPDAEVQRQALMCLQKLMLHNWEYLSR